MRARAVLTRDQRTVNGRCAPSWFSRRSRGDASVACGRTRLRWGVALGGRDGPGPGCGRRVSMVASVLLFGVAAGRRVASAFGELPGASVLFLDTGIDLFPMDLDLGRGFDPELHLTGSHLEDGDLHRIPDPDVLS